MVRLAQVDAAEKGVFVLCNYLETIELLVAVCMRRLRTVGFLFGVDGHSILEVLKQVWRKRSGLVQQFEYLKEQNACVMLRLIGPASFICSKIQSDLLFEYLSLLDPGNNKSNIINLASWMFIPSPSRMFRKRGIDVPFVGVEKRDFSNVTAQLLQIQMIMIMMIIGKQRGHDVQHLGLAHVVQHPVGGQQH